MPEPERRLWRVLGNRQLGGFKFRRQHPIGPYIADFACVSAKLIVEIDGESHFTVDGIAADKKRGVFLQTRGWTVLRFTNTDVRESLEGVAMAIEDALRIAASAPSPAGGRGSG